MAAVTVSLAAATICFLGQCHPALVGADTPLGEFTLTPRRVVEAGYDGEVLKFSETETEVFAVHRVWLLEPRERRLQRLRSQNPADRTTVTHGCVNVDPVVYAQLRACCAGKRLTIQP